MKSGGNQETENRKRMSTAFEKEDKIWEKKKGGGGVKKNNTVLTGSPKLPSNLSPS